MKYLVVERNLVWLEVVKNPMGCSPEYFEQELKQYLSFFSPGLGSLMILYPVEHIFFL